MASGKFHKGGLEALASTLGNRQQLHQRILPPAGVKPVPQDGATLPGPDKPPPGAASPLNMSFKQFRDAHQGTKNLELLKAQYLHRQGRGTTPEQQRMLAMAAHRRSAGRNATPPNSQGLPSTPDAPPVASRTKPGTTPARTRQRR